MAKGFTKDGKFRPTGSKGKSSRQKSVDPTPIQIAKVKPNDPNIEATDGEIFIFDDDGQEVVMWNKDEWIEDPSIIPAIKNAVRLAKKGKVEELKELITLPKTDFDPEVQRVFQIFEDFQNALAIKDDALAIRLSEKFDKEKEKLNSEQLFAVDEKVFDFKGEEREA